MITNTTNTLRILIRLVWALRLTQPNMSHLAALVAWPMWPFVLLSLQVWPVEPVLAVVSLWCLIDNLNGNPCHLPSNPCDS